MQKALLSFFILSLSFSTAWSQEKDEDFDLDSLRIESSSANSHFLHFDSTNLKPVDFLQLYRPLPSPRSPLARTSNIGMPLHSFQVNPQEWDIHFLQGGYRPYILGDKNLSYYKVNRPITILNYMNGEEKEQYFEVLHSQNLGEGLNISFKYDRVNSEAFFPRQLTNHTRFHATYNLQSRNRRYQSHGYYAISNLEAQESGGVYVDEATEESNNTALLGVNLLRAQSRSRGREFGIQNLYKVLQFSDDSAKIDRDYIGLYHKFKWNRSWRNFEHRVNELDRIIDNFQFDSTQTADSSMVNVFSNEVGLQWNEAFYLGARQRDYRYFQNTLTDTTFNSQHIIAGWSDSLLAHHWNAHFEKGISGYEEKEILLKARVSGKLKSIAYALFFNLRTDEVDYFTRRQRTNQRFENNSFKSTAYQDFGFELAEEKSGIQLQVAVKNLTNYIYFDKEAKIQQAEDDIQTVSASLIKRFHFFKHLQLYNQLTFQTISNEELLPLPAFSSYHSLFYENEFFNESLQIQIGADLWLISDYNGYAYAPDNSQFFLNPSDRALGNIQQVDIFLNFGITRNGRFFVKMENILQSDYDEASERVYQYPVPGRALKFGLSWRMVN
ncbi:MAG: hypothetical protein CMP59_07950 [Flavobacteriales bacterium]|mgnify:CR=1 FL=1|nr:hypothetical protein [Flavobacteriales bacterium]|tara:strand:- start:92 stop:1921 length:1830 start_codon:yes stop_codon:yes gene_type:complete